MQPQQVNPIIEAVGAMGGRLIKILHIGIVAGPRDRKWLGIWSGFTWRQGTAGKNDICALGKDSALENIGRRKS
jgi:hypothetical protein